MTSIYEEFISKCLIVSEISSSITVDDLEKVFVYWYTHFYTGNMPCSPCLFENNIEKILGRSCDGRWFGIEFV